ncbi:MAG: bifunctional homocysteine S-methyltransferase/methylenetetrahydrofolate reductase [Lentisphaeria bacterium]|nr:bifunctional homocysteine S-methyltransferase/methylenetetrahydrofolate reductase [Lentisphaeria bacterium]
MNILRKKLNNGVVVFDGATGTELYKRNFFVNNSYEQLNLTRPAVIAEIHKAYLSAGAEVLTANTFNANARNLRRYGISDQTGAINRAGVAIARETAGDKALVAASVGPIGEPESDADTASRSGIIADQLQYLLDADFVIFESMRSFDDLSGVLDAVAEFPDMVYVLSFAAGSELAADKERMLEQITSRSSANPPAALGINCGGGPEAVLKDFEELMKSTRLPIILQPNAGNPKDVDGRSLYMASEEYFSTYAVRFVRLGAAAVGGCCGIGPELIHAVSAAIKPLAGSKAIEITVSSEEQTGLPPAKPLAERGTLGEKLARGEFIRTVELTPAAGFDMTKLLANAKKCKENGIDAINLPDGPRASARITPLLAAITIEREIGIATIPHCCCRDRSLIGVQSELLSYAAAGIRQLLFITGDPPKLGDYPFSSGVFDIDAVGLVAMQNKMNRGVDCGGKSINGQTATLIGVGLDPNAIDQEREYRRICEKAEAGADFIQTQPVFEPSALLGFLKKIEHLHLPVIAGVWPLVSLRNAQFMRNEVPGVVVPDSIMRRIAEPETKEGQLAVGIEIAREALAEIRSAVAGVELSAPFGNVDTALRVMQ